MLRIGFTQILRRLMVVLLSGLMCSCTAYRTFHVEVLQPAIFPVSKGCRIAILDRNIHYENSPLVIAKEEEDLTENRLFEYFVEGLNSVNADVDWVDTLVTLPIPSFDSIPIKAIPGILPADSVKRLCRIYNSDYLASIELQQYSIIKSQISNYCYLRLYSSLSGEVQDSVILRHHIARLEDAMEDIKQGIIFCFWYQGTLYGQRIIPLWQETERRVYDCGKILGVGDALFQNDRIDEALNIWESALRFSPKTSVRARINIAWIYEKEGEFERALEILQEGDQMAKEKNILNNDVLYLRKYISMINNRILQSRKLDQVIIPAEN